MTDLDQLRQRYLYQRSEGQLLEGTVTSLLASLLLAIAGFYDPPFKVSAEASVRSRYYALSRVFAPFVAKQKLYSAPKILKRIARVAVQTVS
ncbi:MAG: hypothetical protein WBB01_23340 [Phormidesmis sp.]